MASRREQENSESENICVLCFKNFEIYSIGVCDHPVCYECSTRMRVLCEQNECPICRGNMPKVIFTRSNDSFGSLFPKYERSNMQDRRYGIYFTSTETQREYYYLLEYRCNRCDPEKCWPFKHFTQLKDHMRKQHELFYCDLCVDNLKIFPFERRAYNRSELGLHRRKGDPDNTSHRGHPLCEFCDQRYVDNDELFRHLRKVHYFCHFCDADGRHLYYKSVDDLKKHFRDEHYLCEEGECAEMPLTAAFRSDIDIKAHIAQEHSRYMSKSATKHARTLELEFTLAPRGRGRRIPNRGDEEGAVGYDDSGGGSLYHNPLTPSDFPALGNLTVQSRPVSLVNFSSKSSGKFTGNDFPSLGGAASSSARPSSAVTISSNSNKMGKSTEISITKTVPNQPRNNDAFPALGKPSVRLSVQNNDSKVSIQINHKPQGAAPPSSRPSASNKKVVTSAAPSTSKAANFPALGKASKVETPMWLPAKPKKDKEESKKAKVAPAPQLPPSDLSQFPNLAKNGNKKSNSVQLGLSSEWVNLNNVNKSRSVKNNNEVKAKEQITTKIEQKPEKASEKTKKKKPKPLNNNDIVKETLKTENNDTNTLFKTNIWPGKLLDDEKIKYVIASNRFVVNSHIRHHPSKQAETIEAEELTNELGLPQDILKKYIVYARENIHPKLQKMDTDKLATIYSQLRQESMATGSLPITARHIESMIRMSEAHARMHLREYVQEDDLNMAVRMMLESFIETQKYSVMKSMKQVFQRYLMFKKDHSELLFYILRQLAQDQLTFIEATNESDALTIEINERDLMDKGKQIGIIDLKPFYQSKIFENNNFVYDASRKVIIHTVPETLTED